MIAELDSISRQFVGTFVLRVIGFGLLFLMHVVLARQLGPEVYGVIAFGQATAAMLAVIATCGLPTGIMRFLPEYAERGDYDLARGALQGTGLMVAAVSLIAAALIAGGALFVNSASSLRTGLLVAALFIPLQAWGLWRGKAVRGLGAIRASIVPEEVLLPALVVVAVWALRPRGTWNATFLYVSCLCGAAVVGYLWLRRVTPQSIRSARAKYEPREWLRISSPMMVGSLLQTGLNRTDVLLLGILFSVESSGVYSAAARTAALCVFFKSVVDLVVPPRLAAAYFGGRRQEFKRILAFGTLFSAAGALPVFGGLLLWPELAMRLFGDGFVGASPILRILAIGQFVNALTGPVGFALLMTGNEGRFARVQLVTTIMMIPCYAMFIPGWGAKGAAIITAAGTALLNLALLREAWGKVLAVPLPEGTGSARPAAVRVRTTGEGLMPTGSEHTNSL